MADLTQADLPNGENDALNINAPRNNLEGGEKSEGNPGDVEMNTCILKTL